MNNIDEYREKNKSISKKSNDLIEELLLKIERLEEENKILTNKLEKQKERNEELENKINEYREKNKVLVDNKDVHCKGGQKPKVDIIDKDTEGKIVNTDETESIAVTVRDLYTKLVENFDISNSNEGKRLLEELFKRISEVKRLNATEKLTLLFINYIFDKHIPVLEKELKYGKIKLGYEKAVYNRLKNGFEVSEFISQNRNYMNIMDIRAREKILDTLIFMESGKVKKGNDKKNNKISRSSKKELGSIELVGKICESRYIVSQKVLEEPTEKETIHNLISGITQEFFRFKGCSPSQFSSVNEEKSCLGNIKKVLNKYHINETNINIEDSYLILYISCLWGGLKEVLEISPYLQEIYERNNVGTKFLNIIESEINISENEVREETIKSFYEKNSGNLTFISSCFKDKMMKKILNNSIPIYKTAFIKEVPTNCKIDKERLVTSKVFIPVKDSNGTVRYVYKKFKKSCLNCKKVYLTEAVKNEVELIFKKYIKENKSTTIKGNVDIDDQLKANELYEEIVDSYKENKFDLKDKFEALCKIHRYEDLLDDRRKLTLLLINAEQNFLYPDLDDKLDFYNIKLCNETILYKKLKENESCPMFVKEYRSQFKRLDSKIKEKLLDEVLKKWSKYSMSGQNDFDLNEESDLRILGYTTSVSREARLSILKNKAIPKLGKARVESHLRWLIKINKGRKDRINAVTEWEYDLRRVLAL